MSAPPTPPGIAQAFAVAAAEIEALEASRIADRKLRRWLEKRRFQVLDICRLFEVPPKALLGPVEASATIPDPEWLNLVQGEIEQLVFGKPPPIPSRDLPDVPLHQRGFGVVDESSLDD